MADEVQGKIGGAPGAGKVYDGDETQRTGMAAGATGAGTAMARETEGKPFEFLRDWINEGLKTDPDITVAHHGVEVRVEELTADGKLKLVLPNRGGTELVAFDETYIEPLVRQLI